MRLVSYNIHSCVGTDGRRDPARIAAVLEQLEPDVVALQEVDSRVSRGGLDQATILAVRLGMGLVEGPLLREHIGHYGNALLSRWPLRLLTEAEFAAQGRERRGWMEVEILEPDGPTWNVVVTHLDLVSSVRSAQLAELAARVAGMDGPLVLAGDLNEWRPWLRRLDGLRKVTQVLAARASFPSRLPVLALDRLALKGAVVRAGPIVATSPLARCASDHLPLWVEVGPARAGRRAPSGPACRA
ncbi:endonuclease/exonuclease/phosphatase family protein [Benzoatithermus flavus]|uniref:Endonuclease/exonuclease/phosphatase family protein n=1 Tax=Benzoatithermus flavus TaxID=3108223 RepID=A0ABU8XRW9_9PROT